MPEGNSGRLPARGVSGDWYPYRDRQVMIRFPVVPLSGIAAASSPCGRTSPKGLRPLDLAMGYCTVRATVPVAVVEPEVPVTVMV
jgi:hypothetical protein